MGDTAERVLIVGIGNLLLGDEGLGVHVARALLSADTMLPPSVEVIDAGTALMEVLPQLVGYDRWIVVDAVRGGEEPGTIYRLDLRAELDAPDESTPLSLHQCDATDALRVAQVIGLLPSRIELIGAEPDRLDPGVELSPALTRAAVAIVSLLVRETALPASRGVGL